MNKDAKKKGFWSWLWRRKWWIILFAIVAGIAIYFFTGSSSNQGTGFATATISKGDLRQVVTATGEIQPLNTINVGSQVSGTIEAIYVDYNSKVKKGDILLKIEPSVLQASVDEAYASLVSSESQRNYAKSEYERNKTLFDAGYISRAELEQSQTTYE
ncbi:MAG TPA: biotin/lipoyl-binding protein, partial [Candidatus Enterousia avicola]|nr:biotin/lipoyl-binding protein [Candidatus Enterousia avicola]